LRSPQVSRVSEIILGGFISIGHETQEGWGL
jgi:hypothetical protein